MSFIFITWNHDKSNHLTFKNKLINSLMTIQVIVLSLCVLWNQFFFFHISTDSMIWARNVLRKRACVGSQMTTHEGIHLQCNGKGKGKKTKTKTWVYLHQLVNPQSCLICHYCIVWKTKKLINLLFKRRMKISHKLSSDSLFLISFWNYCLRSDRAQSSVRSHCQRDDRL